MTPGLLRGLIVLLAAVVLGLLAWPQAVGAERLFGVAQLVALRGVLAAAALVLALLAALIALGSRRLRRVFAAFGVLLVGFAAVNGAVIALRGTGDAGFQTRTDRDLVVLSWNTLGGAPGAGDIAQLAIQNEADVIALPETTGDVASDVAERLTASGRPMQHFTIAFDRVSKARSTSLLISTALGDYDVDPSAGNTSQLPSVVARPVSGDGPVIIAAHTVAPLPDLMTSWRDDLQTVRGFCERSDVIMAGDFNATLDHMAGLGAAAPGSGRRSGELGGCADAALASGSGGVGTWPTQLPTLLSAPIDHVFVSAGWQVVGFRVIGSHDGDGSDHRPVLAQLRPGG